MEYRTQDQINTDHTEFLKKKRALGYSDEDKCQFYRESKNDCLLEYGCICSNVNMGIPKNI